MPHRGAAGVTRWQRLRLYGKETAVNDEDAVELFGRENFPNWVNHQLDEILEENADAFTSRGISTKSLTFSLKLGRNVGRVDIHTSIGVIPYRVVNAPYGV
jgi:hypothetical protein